MTPKPDSAAVAAKRLELYGIVKRGIDAGFRHVRPTQGGETEAETHRLLFEASVALSQLASGEPNA